MQLRTKTRAAGAAVAAMTLALVTFTPVATAAHQFNDVPDGHLFHTEIGLFKDTNITTGCTATDFCPQNAVLRQAMAAYIVRALGLVVRPGETTQKGVPGSRVDMIDDDASFVGTSSSALELWHNGMRGLRLEEVAGLGTNVIGGFPGNSVDSGQYAATIAGGGNASLPNRVGGFAGAVSGGSGNTVDGIYGMVPGGKQNTAAGAYAFAAGRRAKAIHGGSFVWADSTDADFASGKADQFKVRAGGGAVFVRGSSSPTNTNAALQLESFVGDGEAAWLRSVSSTATTPVLKLNRHPSASNDFLDCVNWDGVNPGIRKCHINSAGTFVAGSDFAEALPVRGAKARFRPGDVLVISRRHAGEVEHSRRPFDSAVIGVYSTRPAVLGADKDGVTRVGRRDVPVAITGIVPVKVSAENGGIRPGDLLTTARTPGHAMRAGSTPRAGTVLGKSLGVLAQGKGRIKMLVMPR